MPKANKNHSLKSTCGRKSCPKNVDKIEPKCWTISCCWRLWQSSDISGPKSVRYDDAASTNHSIKQSNPSPYIPSLENIKITFGYAQKAMLLLLLFMFSEGLEIFKALLKYRTCKNL